MLVKITAIFVGLMILMAVGCTSTPTTNADGPRLVRDVAIEATDAPPTRIISPTPLITATLPTLEVNSPEQQITVEADFILVTPTLPPSKTPTSTPTLSATPSQTPTPSVTVTTTATFQAFPTSIIEPITAPIVQPQDVICDTQWFFIQPRPPGCPLAPVSASQGVYQSFENGYMIWVGQLDAIYVMYSEGGQPAWEVWRDEFDEGEPEFDPNWPMPPDNLWQPRRGFGTLWRREASVRDRIGWATMEWEEPFSTKIQNSNVGTIFISAPEDVVFALLTGNMAWERYTGTNDSTNNSENNDTTSNTNGNNLSNPFSDLGGNN